MWHVLAQILADLPTLGAGVERLRPSLPYTPRVLVNFVGLYSSATLNADVWPLSAMRALTINSCDFATYLLLLR